MSTSTQPAPTAKSTSLSPRERKDRLKNILERMIPDFETLLQKRVDPNILIYAVMNSIYKSPKLLGCTEKSIIRSVVYLAQIQLMPDTPDNHAHLIPFKNDCTVIVNYQGYIELAHRSERVRTIYANLVYEKDEFEEELGSERRLVHKPYRGGDGRGDIIGAYAVAELLNGGKEWVFMSKAELDKIRDTSKAKDKPDSPWKKWPEEMYKKCPIRRLHKFIPTTPQMSLARQLDDLAAAEKPQDGLADMDALDIDYEDITDEPEPESAASEKLASKLKKKNANGKPKPEPEPKTKPEPEKKAEPKPDRKALEAELFDLLTEHEDALKMELGEDNEVFKLTPDRTADWTAQAIKEYIDQIKLVIHTAGGMEANGNGADDEEGQSQLDLGQG